MREEQAREEQDGFRTGCECIDQTFTLRQLLDHRHTFQIPTIIVFLDIRATFSFVDGTALWDYLLRNGLPEKHVSLLQDLHRRTSGQVRAYGHLSLSFCCIQWTSTKLQYINSSP
ncbi:Acyl-CoA:glycerol-3-phosphate acyltransferase [Fasciola gigantica]|uniref:Acyl-CoA:glycerol-3-phosphate acyltransferase n=1 Tax=Fasciola gigantica TaxID=46835 RepID=A0A504YLX1_FASGI|nr:Acyl-CoA:glycerol-3-phosphate acyltransferase [Fasciola gigantica]